MSIPKLKEHNISGILQQSSLPRLETEVLLSYVLGRSREFLLTHPEFNLSPARYQKFQILAVKRLKNWPIAYLTGHKEFYGLDFKVTPAVLTPRPETEMIVDQILALVSPAEVREAVIIDLGTGSGAIIIALASELRRRFPAQWAKTKLSAVDISAAALSIARQNAAAHNLDGKIKFYRGNLLAPLRLNSKNMAARQLIIAANLPYLTKAQIKTSPSIQREPKLALDGGAAGLKYYQELFKQLSILHLVASPITLLCEIDPGQKTSFRTLVKKYWSGASLNLQRDLAGRYRLAQITLEH